ncbi:MAG: hypothetical protein UX37_C0018G0008 [Microgenomates group bacterium GW2011_GWA2_46_16]|nr:MAG: hypothetical protein UX37_C0018G0008 [Microgenomates group bacterium GW2011_GWA2_46_16]
MTDIELKERIDQLHNLVSLSEDMDGEEIQDVVNSHDEVVGVFHEELFGTMDCRATLE